MTTTNGTDDDNDNDYIGIALAPVVGWRFPVWCGVLSLSVFSHGSTCYYSQPDDDDGDDEC